MLATAFINHLYPPSKVESSNLLSSRLVVNLIRLSSTQVVVPEGKLWKFTKSKGRKLLFSASPQLRSTKGVIDEKAAQVIALPPEERDDEKLLELDT